MVLPTFFVAGVPKAGTTALHVALASHPDIFMSPVKEPKYFLVDGPPPHRGGPGDARTFRQFVWRREDYEALFDAAPSHAPRGESTPFYLYLPQAQERIRRSVPDARVIVLLRDPVDRAHSNWSHLWSAGLEPERDFLRACRLEDQRAAAGWALFWRYLDLGRYGEQLEALYSRFPREQVLPVRYRELRDSPIAVLDRICTFLGVETGRIATIPAENVTTQASNSPRNRAISALLRSGSTVEHRLPAAWWPRVDSFLSGHLQREQRPRQPLTDEQRAALVRHFADDVRRLERLTGESFAAWRDPGRPVARAALPRSDRIGTAAGSIDRPIPDPPRV